MRRHGRRLGCAVIGAGLIIVLALVLPTAAWWLIFGMALIAAGVWLLRCGC